MANFAKQVKQHAPSAADIRHRRWIYVPYDRYTDRVGPLAEQPAEDTGIVIVESTAKALRRPYHKKKLAVLISNMRHFALEQAAHGVAVLYHFSPDSHGTALRMLQHDRKLPPLSVMQPAERELRLDLAAAQEAGLRLETVPDTTWASTAEDFLKVYGPWKPGRHYVMDGFYRHMRERTGILMRGGKPVGGKFSFDSENRNPYRNEVPVPAPPSFAPDAVTEEVLALVEQTYGHHFGTLQNFDLPCTGLDADVLWQHFLTHLLPSFGRFEDAMRDDQAQLFHSKTSVLLNLGRLLAMDLVRDVAEAAAQDAAPLQSCEGFIRQLLGWREFMRHLHEQTDGYRSLRGTVPDERRTVEQEVSPDQTEHAAGAYRPAPDDPARPSALVERDNASTATADPYAGATPSFLGAALPLPAAYWGTPSGLHCLDTTVAQVVREGWSHHITRLMVLSNLAVLCGFSPRELTDWFWFAYVDAYDWVVEPNVLGMATYADGGMTATKPYVSGAAYINRMSNFCPHCRFDPKKSTGPDSCPFTALYWTFLDRHRELLQGNPRMRMPFNTLRHKPEAELVQLRARAAEAIDDLGKAKRPEYGAEPQPAANPGAPLFAASRD